MKIIRPFIFSILLSCFFTACNQKTDEQKPPEISKEVMSGSLHLYAYIVDYVKDNKSEIIIVDTVQIINNDNLKSTSNQDQRTTDGFNILNLIKDSTLLKINRGTEIVFQTLSYDSTGNFNFNEKLDYETFLNLVSSKEMERFRNIPFKFQIKDGIILSIKEIYIP